MTTNIHVCCFAVFPWNTTASCDSGVSRYLSSTVQMPTLVSIIQQALLQNSMNVLFLLVTDERRTWVSVEKHGRKYLMNDKKLKRWDRNACMTFTRCVWEFPSFRPKKDPEVLTFQTGLLLSVTHVKTKKKKKRKNPWKKKKKKRRVLLHSLTFIQELGFSRDLHPGQSSQLHQGRHQSSALHVQLHNRGLYQQIGHFPDDKGTVLFQNNRSLSPALCALKLYSTYKHWQWAALEWQETYTNLRVAITLPEAARVPLPKRYLGMNTLCLLQMPPTSLKSLSSPMCSECCRRRSFLRCVVALRLAQRLGSQRERRREWNKWEERAASPTGGEETVQTWMLRWMLAQAGVPSPFGKLQGGWRATAQPSDLLETCLLSASLLIVDCKWNIPHHRFPLQHWCQH